MRYVVIDAIIRTRNHASSCVVLQFENYTGRKIAIDASMAMYQFLVAVRSGGPGANQTMLTNEAGEVTSHIQGMFNRTIRMMTGGIRPVYIFDGKPPQMKGGELAKRLAKRAKAESDLAAAKAAEDVDEMNKFSSRLVKVTRQHNEDCKELLRLMGVPVFTAPCEAEAQCAELARKGKVYATATEDMDALTFRTPKLVRKLTFSQMKGKEKQMIMEIDFDTMLAGLDITYEQFVDVCILCGCDYCSTIKGIGPKTALRLIKEHKSIENVIKSLDKTKYKVPDDWLPQRIPKKQLEEPEPEVEDDEQEEEMPQDDAAAGATTEDAVAMGDAAEAAETPVEASAVSQATEAKGEDDDLQDTPIKGKRGTESQQQAKATEDEPAPAEEEEALDDENYITVPPLYVQARQLFLQCEVLPADEVELKWEPPQEAKLTEFLVDKMGFSAERVASGIKRLKEAQVQKSQMRMDRYASQ
jgi:flap endonuclease-1